MGLIFYCNNKDCGLFELPIQHPPYKIRFRNGKKEIQTIKCSYCGESISYENESEKEIHFSTGIFSSMSDIQKRNVLIKRSDKSFKEFGRDEKNFRKREIMGINKDIE